MSQEYTLQMPAGQEPLPVSSIDVVASTVAPEQPHPATSDSNWERVGVYGGIFVGATILLSIVKGRNTPHDTNFHQQAAVDYASRGKIRNAKKIQEEIDS